MCSWGLSKGGRALRLPAPACPEVLPLSLDRRVLSIAGYVGGASAWLVQSDAHADGKGDAVLFLCVGVHHLALGAARHVFSLGRNYGLHRAIPVWGRRRAYGYGRGRRAGPADCGAGGKDRARSHPFPPRCTRIYGSGLCSPMASRPLSPPWLEPPSTTYTRRPPRRLSVASAWENNTRTIPRSQRPHQLRAAHSANLAQPQPSG